MSRRRLAILIAVVVAVIVIPYRSFVHYTEQGFIGIMKNQFTGEIRLDHPGWNINPPWVWVAMVDTRPMRVCVSTTGRGFNCKLAQFDAAHYQEFVATEGWRYYWWANRLSFNGGYDEEYRGTRDLVRGYAYSVKPYPFVKVLRDYADDE